MERLTEAILQRTSALPEGAPVSAKMLLHLGTRPAVDQSLSRLARRGKLLRAGRGMYLSPVTSRFGTHAPSAHRLIEELSAQRGEAIVPSGATSANALRTHHSGSHSDDLLDIGPESKAPSREAGDPTGACPVLATRLCQGKRRRDRPCAGMGRPGKSSCGSEGDRGEGAPNRDPKVAQQVSRFPSWMASALSRSAVDA